MEVETARLAPMDQISTLGTCAKPQRKESLGQEWEMV